MKYYGTFKYMCQISDKNLRNSHNQTQYMESKSTEEKWGQISHFRVEEGMNLQKNKHLLQLWKISLA